MKKNEIMMMKV